MFLSRDDDNIGVLLRGAEELESCRLFPLDKELRRLRRGDRELEEPAPDESGLGLLSVCLSIGKGLGCLYLCG